MHELEETKFTDLWSEFFCNLDWLWIILSTYLRIEGMNIIASQFISEINFKDI